MFGRHYSHQKNNAQTAISNQIAAQNAATNAFVAQKNAELDAIRVQVAQAGELNEEHKTQIQEAQLAITNAQTDRKQKLDEPTQHLDFVGLAALEAVLAAWRGGLLVVSHDPEFLAAIGVSGSLTLGTP